MAGLFKLGDDPSFAAVSGDAVAHQANVFCGADEGDGDGVDAVLEGEFEILGIFFSQRGNEHRNAGQIDAFVFAEQAAVDDLADHVAAHHFLDAQLDEAVRKQNAGALLDVFRQSFEGGAYQGCRARNFARSNGEHLAGDEHHRFVILKLGGAYFGSLKIGQDAEGFHFLAAHLADQLDHRQFFLVRAMGEVQADYIDAGANQVAEDGLTVGCWAESCNDFCAAFRERAGVA